MTSGSSSERRAHARFELMAQVRVKKGKVDYLMDLADISSSGALFSMGSLEPPPWAQVGRVLEIGIIHPVELDSVDVKGEIVRVQDSGDDTRLAVRFVEIGAELQAKIDELVALARGGSGALARGGSGALGSSSNESSG